MKYLVLCFLAVAFAGCSPKDADDDDGKSAPAVAEATPTPAPGSWMWQKQDPKKDGWSLNNKGSLNGKGGNPLGIGDDPLNQKAKK
jgi:hypothetical protein